LRLVAPEIKANRSEGKEGQGERGGRLGKRGPRAQVIAKKRGRVGTGRRAVWGIVRKIAAQLGRGELDRGGKGDKNLTPKNLRVGCAKWLGFAPRRTGVTPAIQGQLRAEEEGSRRVKQAKERWNEIVGLPNANQRRPKFCP